MYASGDFEISENDSTVVTGRIYIPTNVEKEMNDLRPHQSTERNETPPMKTHDIYKELRIRGYKYSGQFKGIMESDIRGKQLLITLLFDKKLFVKIT